MLIYPGTNREAWYQRSSPSIAEFGNALLPSVGNIIRTFPVTLIGNSDAYFENDLLTSMTSEGAQWIFSKNNFFKSVHQAEKNEL